MYCSHCKTEWRPIGALTLPMAPPYACIHEQGTGIHRHPLTRNVLVRVYPRP